MNYMSEIISGSLLGMGLAIAVKSVGIQISRKYALNFWDAIVVYTTKHTGPMVVGAIVIMIGMFLFPDILDNYQTDNGEYTGFIQHIVKWLRGYAVILGTIAQGLGFMIVYKSEQKFLLSHEEKKENSK